QRVIGLKPGTAPTRIAIVDDKKYNRQLLAKLLATVGFEVREAADGQEALALLSEWRPALMLMDMRMPVMDGYEATRRIKAMPDGGNTLIVGVTASAFEEKKNEVLAAGVDGFLAKPFKEEQLFGVIHDLLGTEYEYAAAEAAETGADSAISSRAMLQAVATLPKELVARLREAVSLGHMEDLAALFDEVASFAPDFAGRLRDLSDQYEYNTLAEILGEADGSSKE
ncbi:MAG TPA: response regulator, partial [Candidatus Hydrogenedentes bacterium]|nr:response regulator [Candidatus Hydrogenedentota bacterium]